MTTILIAEDDDLLLDVLVQLFEMKGYAVRSATSGNQAIRILQEEPEIPVVISDYYMPDGNGRQLLSYVRNQHPTHPAFILITGQTDLGLDDNLKAMGLDEFLLKPFPIRELLAIVARYVASARA